MSRQKPPAPPRFADVEQLVVAHLRTWPGLTDLVCEERSQVADSWVLVSLLDDATDATNPAPMTFGVIRLEVVAPSKVEAQAIRTLIYQALWVPNGVDVELDDGTVDRIVGARIDGAIFSPDPDNDTPRYLVTCSIECVPSN